MSGVLRATLQRPHDHGFDAGVVNRARRAGTRLVVQPGHTLLHKTPPPFAYGLPVQPELGRHFRVPTTFRTGQHDPGSQSQRLRRLPPHRQRRQFGLLIIAQYQGGKLLDNHWRLRRRLPPSLARRRESMIANL
jgi:hypothetical protein